MADKTQINLERIRACDAEWEESKHPRSENGQFTSGSGAHVSKIQSGGKAKVGSIKAGEIAKNQERYDNAHKSMAANYLSDLTNAVKGGDYETAREKLERHEKDKKRYDQLTAQNNKFKAAKATLEKARPGIAKMREQAKAAQPDIKGMEAAIDKKKSELKTAIKKQLPVDQIKKIREDLDQMKFDYRAARFPRQYGSKAAAPASKKDDANKAAKEQIFKQAAAASKKTAEAKAAKEAAAAKKTLSDIDSRIAEAKRKGDIKSVSFLEAAKASAQKKAAAPAVKSKAQLKKEYEDAFNAYRNFTEPRSGGMRLQYPNEADRMQAMKAAKEKVTKAEKAYMQALENESKPAAAPTSKSKPTTRFDKDMAKADKSYEDFREVMQKRKSEIDVLNERLRTTKNSFVAKATKQELDRLVSEYNQLDEMY